jgi:hypothetical protein
MYDPNALAAIAQWLPVFGVIGIVLIGVLAWSAMR